MEDEDVRGKSKQAALHYGSGDYGSAFTDYLALAEAGYTASQRFVGWLYFRGEGVAKDFDQAILWFERAANAHDIEAMFGLGRVYMAKGENEAAYKWYEKSASKNYPPSLYWVARFHRDGVLGYKDESTAFRVFQQAAGFGHLKSLREYSIMLMKGHGGLLGRLKGIFLFGKLIVNAVRQGIHDRSDPKAVI